jgi:hypothetical protein
VEVGHVFGRRGTKTRQELVRAELGETIGHLKQAAAHAAGGVGASVGPRYGSMKDRMGNTSGQLMPSASKVSNVAAQGWDSTIAAFAPLAEAARQGSAKAAKLPSVRDSRDKRKKRAVSENEGHHVPTGLITLLAAGAAVGATGALVARRRNRTKWAQYQPSTVHEDATSLIDSTKSRMSGAPDSDQPSTTAKLAAWAKDQTKSARRRLHDATADMSDRPDDMADRTSDLKDRTSDGTSHLADKADARMNDASDRRMSSTDEVDDLLRGARNGRV